MHVILSSYIATEIIDAITEMELYPKYFPEINQYLHNMNSIYNQKNYSDKLHFIQFTVTKNMTWVT